MFLVPTRLETRIDWKTDRDRIDLAIVTTRLLGPAPGRRGERGRKLWWPCPFHQDRNPSFCVDPGKRWWHCFGCGANGDAATLVMRFGSMTFPEAIAYLTDRPSPSGKGMGPRPQPAPPPEKKPRPATSGMAPEAAAALATEAAARLWTPEAALAVGYLRERGLSEDTIRKARLGIVIEPLPIPGKPRGVVIPWWRGDVPTLIKVRQPEGRTPKYHEAFRDRDRHEGIYPGPGTIRPGRPLVIVEGEFDALCLGEALGDLAAVVTLGSASARPGPSAFGKMLVASPWFVATDGDGAGDGAASGWPSHARRVRPPSPFKDWTEARVGGVDLARWWGDVLRGDPKPALFIWEELSTWRWGPAVGDASPGIDIKAPRPRPTSEPGGTP